jgi:hypothetical protein
MVRAESKFPQTGWVDNAIGEYFGLTSPKVATVVDFLWQWMMPFAASALILICYHHWNTRQNRKKAGLDKSTVETDALVLVDRDQPVASRSMVKAATECFPFLKSSRLPGSQAVERLSSWLTRREYSGTQVPWRFAADSSRSRVAT